MIYIIDCGYSSIYKLEDLVDQYMDYKTIPALDLKEELVDTEELKGFVISHSSINILSNQVEKFLSIVELVLSFNRPVLGIGFGHHLLGLLYDAQIHHSPYVNGVVEIGILNFDPLFKKLPTDIYMVKDISSGISVPREFELIASSDSSINEAMKKVDAPIFGVQFLPEVSGNHGAIVMENFISLVEKDQCMYEGKEK